MCQSGPTLKTSPWYCAGLFKSALSRGCGGLGGLGREERTCSDTVLDPAGICTLSRFPHVVGHVLPRSHLRTSPRFSRFHKRLFLFFTMSISVVEGGVCTGADAGSHCSAGRGCCHQQLLLGLQQCLAGWYLQMKARTQSFQLNIRPQEMIDGCRCTDTMSPYQKVVF